MIETTVLYTAYISPYSSLVCVRMRVETLYTYLSDSIEIICNKNKTSHTHTIFEILLEHVHLVFE